MTTKHEKKIAQLKAQLEQLEARAREESRKAETKKKVVLGGAVLALIKQHPEASERLIRMLDPVITRPYDRRSVGLPVPDDTQADTTRPEAADVDVRQVFKDYGQ